MATRDNLPLRNCDSDGKAENKRQRMVVWLIYYLSECQEEVILVNFPCASEKVSCQWASVDISSASVALHFHLPNPHNSRETWERGCLSHSLISCYISLNGMFEHRKASISGQHYDRRTHYTPKSRETVWSRLKFINTVFILFLFIFYLFISPIPSWYIVM